VKDFYKQYAVAGYDNKTKEIVIKVVNAESQPFIPKITIEKAGTVLSTGEIITLSAASGKDENTFSSPMKISPVKQEYANFSSDFTYTFKPWSFTVLRIKTK
jgi:alpha-L-arabinofuranosidase